MSQPTRRRAIARAIAMAGSGALIAGSALIAVPGAAAPAAPEEVAVSELVVEEDSPDAAAPEVDVEAVAPEAVVVPQAVSVDAPVVINEVYGGGGNNTAPYTNDFVELRNVSTADVDLTGWSVQYASAAGSTWNNMWVLDGLLEAGGYALLQGASGGSNGVALPTPDFTAGVNMSATAGKVALVNNSTQLTGSTGIADLTQVVDLVGFGSNASAYAGAGPAPAPSNSTAIERKGDSQNTADNAADFAVVAPSPQGGGIVEAPDPEPQDDAIAEIRAAGLTDGRTVTTRGVVTAHYPTGGFNGYVIQTPGTGGDDTDDRTASDAIFIFSSATVGSVALGDYVEVTGTVGEFNGLGQISVPAGGVTVLDDDVEAPEALAMDWPATNAERDAIESMLIHPEGTYTISNTYNVQFGEIGIALGDEPLIQPTQVGRPGSAEAAAQAASNAALGVIVDDGSSWNYLSTAAARDFAPPYVNLVNPLRVGATLTFTEPMVVDYRNNAWKLNPTSQVLASEDLSTYPVSWDDTRQATPDAVGGDISVASFNVLNYFTTLGYDTPGCVPYLDRDGNGVTVREGCLPRGAWAPADLERQQSKLVAAINAVDASVIGLMEIENSAKLGETADEATATLVGALNEAAGETKWAYVAPAADVLPPIAEQDVITNAIIYQPAEVEPVGDAVSIADQSGAGQAFVNAREPIGQRFVPVDGTEQDAFFVAVNHFKSKGSAGPFPGDADAGDGQGASNGSRVLQATALKDWIPTVTEEGDAVALIGDFNSYAQEDPMWVLYDAGYTNAELAFDVDNWSYNFSGQDGSLDHVVLNDAAMERAEAATIWSINSGESIALEYSRYNNYAANYNQPNAFRSSDHDPVIVGLNNAADVTDEQTLRLLNINDFHGRIDNNTVAFAGTIEQQRAEIAAEGGSSLFLSAGDNIGASLFASAVAEDQPTIDVLNALDLAASAIGNHELDRGLDDLIDRVINGGENAKWTYLAANVTDADGDLVLPPYATFNVDGLVVGVIGVVTEETPALVSPGGIVGLEFGDPIDAVNQYAELLADQTDIIVAEYHEGAGAGIPDGSTLEQEVAAGGTFAKIVEETSPLVDVIFTGHTHKQYAWDAPIPGADGKTRPILQTGSYGEFIGQVDLTVVDGEVVSYTAENIARTTTPADELVEEFPVVAEVKEIVDDALAQAEIIGSVPVGSVTADITTAFAGGSYVDGKYVGPGPLPTTGRDDRAAESTLGNLVANSLVASLSSELRGGAEIGVVNPGGLRSELLYGEDGVITYAEANAVLPFVNNLWTTTLSGQQFKIMLEQQWQTNPDGTIPSRPYLQLGLSDNVSYTYDESRAMGDRITSVTIDGEPLDSARNYRIGSFSFLLQGGDNFRIFNEGLDTRDSGLVDRDAWIDYITESSPLSPSFAERAVGAPLLDAVDPGEEVTFTLSGLNLTSLGSPLNTAAKVILQDTVLGEFDVADGSTEITVTVPADTELGEHTLTINVAPSGTVVELPLTVGVETAESKIRLLNINDFHGRIDNNTVKFAGTIEQQRAAIEAEGGSSLFLSAGDNIGASVFASAVAEDQPTIDVLNVLELAASAIGNHELDRGLDDLLGRVIDEGTNAGWDYLAANVTLDDELVLRPFSVFDVAGVSVGVIGVVTQETPALVSPGGIVGLEFGDPVDAVNKYAAILSDGDPSNGEADIIVAEYHEGAGAGIPDGSTLEQEIAAGGAFAKIVLETSPEVDVIFTGHTHKQYAWEAPIPGVDGKTRPIVQTGSYGEFIGQVDLVVENGNVISHDAVNIARVTTADAELVAEYPRVAEVKEIVDAALAYADVIGSRGVGSVTRDITTAYSGGSYVDGRYVGPGPLPTSGRDDRAAESTLGNLVANSLVASLSSELRGGAEIGVVNPGGLRSELFRGTTSVVTYAEANAVLPFVNNLWTTTLTGEQFKVMLEQQWQTNPDGTIPSRPYLQLGLSDNVTYTYDESRAMGDRITSVTIDGVPLDPAAEYRIGSFSFLLQGGDNFRVFNEGTDTRDSGLVDRDAWIDYISENSPLSPNFARSAVAVPEVGSVVAGGSVAFPVSDLNLTSLGSPLNTVAAVTLDGQNLGAFPVADGATEINVVIPPSTPAGLHFLEVSVAPSGTLVTVPVEVEAAFTFTDVPPGTMFYDDIMWLAAEGIATGYADGTFRPLDTVNRDAMAAFLYRAAGEPEYTAPATSPFLDVTTSTQFYKEISWLAETGISTGWTVAGGREFRPLQPVARDAMAAFLYRFAGTVLGEDVEAFVPPTTSPFVDVSTSTMFYREISWLGVERISTGWQTASGSEFRPLQPVARDAMAAFLYRMLA